MRCRGSLKSGVVADSFNSINGEPSCSNGLLMNTLARDTWNFSGFTVSDCGGVPAINTGHYRSGSPEEAVARALHGGLDAECGELEMCGRYIIFVD